MSLYSEALSVKVGEARFVCTTRHAPHIQFVFGFSILG